MELAFIFGLVLLAAVLLSETTRVSMLSIATLTLALGFALGEGGLHLGGHQLNEEPLLRGLAELALFTLLFTDGARLQLHQLRRHWALPARALLIGLPLTLALAALLAHVVVGLSWLQSFLVAAALCPTDPVFASDLVENEDVPTPLRRLLAIESGLNDGLAVPFVVIFLALLGSGQFSAGDLALDVFGATALGIAIPWLAGRLHRLPIFDIACKHEPLYGFALGMILLTACSLLGLHPFLAAFAGGITMRAVSPDLRHEFHEFGRILGELLKLASVFVFGLLLSRELVDRTDWTSFVFAALVLLLVRPLAFWICLAGSQLDPKERLAAAWFGPRGFASVLFALWIFHSGIEDAGRLCALVAVVSALSMLAHTGTDTYVARWFGRSL